MPFPAEARGAPCRDSSPADLDAEGKSTSRPSMAGPTEALPLDGETIRHGRDLGVPVDEAFTAIEMVMLVDRAVRRSGPHQGGGSGSSRAADPIIGPPEVLNRPVGDWADNQPHPIADGTFVPV